MKLLIKLSAICLLFLPLVSHAYVGPGGGLTAIGTIVAFLGAIFLLILGFFWYPVKRLIKSIRKEPDFPNSSEPKDC